MSETKAPVGILFVHGIGSQRKGQTLADFGGALYRWLDIAKGRGGSATARVQLTDARLTMLEDPSAPAHGRLLLTSGSGDVEWLLAESWWAESFGAPGFADLARWGLGIIPWTIGSHFGAHVQYEWSARAKSRGLRRRLLWLARLTRSIAGLIASLFLSLGALVALAMMLALASLPIPKLREWLGGLQQAIAASLGDSYTFVARPFEGAAMVAQVSRDLDWLAKSADTLVVIAHSQGAAVSCEALRRRCPDALKLLVTFGSGLRKLEELKHIVENGRRFKRAAALTLLGAALTPFFVIAFARMASVGWPASSDASVPMILGEALVVVAVLVAGLIDFVEGTGTDPTRAAREDLQKTGVRWVDCYSIADPVPNGATFAAHLELPNASVKQASIEVCNQQSLMSDHTSYWSNLDEFVGIVIAALQSAAVPGLPVAADDAEWMTAIRRRRRWRVVHLVAIRWSALAGFVATFIRDREAWWNLTTWAVGASAVWLQKKVGWTVLAQASPRPAAGYVLAMAALVAVPYVAARVAWRRWDSIEAQDLVAHWHPDDGPVPMIMSFGAQVLVAIGIALGGVGPLFAGILFGVFIGLIVLHLLSAPAVPKSSRPRPPVEGRSKAEWVVFLVNKSLPFVSAVAAVGFVVGVVRRSSSRISELLAKVSLRSILIALSIGAGLFFVRLAIRWRRRRRMPKSEGL